MHIVNRCLKNMHLSICYQDVSFPQSVHPYVCNGSNHSQEDISLSTTFRCKFPQLIFVLKVLLPLQEKVRLLLPT